VCIAPYYGLNCGGFPYYSLSAGAIAGAVSGGVIAGILVAICVAAALAGGGGYAAYSSFTDEAAAPTNSNPLYVGAGTSGESAIHRGY